MLQREQALQPLQDPWPVQLLCGGGTRLYVDPHTLTVKLESDVNPVTDIRGGILSEEMGVGKTIECICLFLLTRGTLPNVSDNEEGMASAVTSQVALEWPQKDCHGGDPAPENDGELEALPNYSKEIETMEKVMRQYVRSHKKPPTVASPSPEAAKVELPKLSDICTHRVRATGQPFSGEQFEDQPEVQFQLRLLQKRLIDATPFFHLWPPRPTRSYRVEIPRKPLRIYLSPATLVLVPGKQSPFCMLLSLSDPDTAAYRHTSPSVGGRIPQTHGAGLAPNSLAASCFFTTAKCRRSGQSIRRHPSQSR